MIKKLDLAALAEGIQSPYRPIPLATSGELEASLFICQGRKPWQRRIAHDEILIVLEGVITLEGPAGKVVVNEGDLGSAPRTTSYSAHSGMRSSVLLLEAVEKNRDSANGHHPTDDGAPGAVHRIAAAVDVNNSRVFEWSEVGVAGHHVVKATRLVGTSSPYRIGSGTVMLLIYRGVLEYESDGETGSVVGSEMLVMTEGTEITLSSDRGATVFLVTPIGASVPDEATSGATSSDASS